MARHQAALPLTGVGERTLEAGDCMYQKPGIRHRVLDYSDDPDVLEITVPAAFETVTTVR